MDIEVIHNHLADPGDRVSLLLAHQGNRTIEIVRVEGEYVVRVTTQPQRLADAKRLD